MSTDIERIVQALSVIHVNVDRQNAENYLKYAEENTSQYYSILQTIYLQNNLDNTVRTLAAIGFKNGIDKCWRRTAKSAINKEEKATIRKNLLLNRSLPRDVARQCSTAIARIARVDFPLEWPTLFDELLKTISEAQFEPNLLFANMWTLHQVIKTLCSQRIASARENFQLVAPSLLHFVFSAYSNYSSRWLSHTSYTAFDLTLSDLALKIARRLICYGFVSPHDNDDSRQFFALLSSQVETMWRIFSNAESNAQAGHAESSYDMETLVAKHLLHAGKFCMVLELSSNSMENYAINHSFMLMPGSTQLVKIYWGICTSAASSPQPDIQKVVIQGLILMKQCIKLASTPETHLKLMRNSERAAMARSLELLGTELFSTESLVWILECLVTLFLVLQADDLESWEDDPETWMNSQDEAHWEFHTRSCAERVFLDFFAQFKSILVAPFLQVLAKTLSAKSGRELQLKEAMYNAIGVAAPHLHDAIHFDQFLEQLSTEIEDISASSIFKRRILILISQWVNVACSEDRLPLVYHIIGSQMHSPGGLSLAAAFTVGRIIDSWEWNSARFEPFAKDYIASLSDCLSVATEVESKMKLISSIGLIFERMGCSVADSLGSVLEQIPQEWDKCDNEHLLRVALLGLLTRLVLSQKGNSSHSYAIALPLIRYSTTATNLEHIYLMDEALELWLAVLQNADKPDEYILGLLPILSQENMLPSATDTLKTILLIIESYLLLFGNLETSIASLQALLHDMVIMLPQLSKSAQSHFIRVLHLGAKVLRSKCLSEVDIRNMSEYLFSQTMEIQTMASICCLLSQFIVTDARRIIGIWSTHSQGDMTSPMLQKMFELFDNIGHPKHRKLFVMAMTALTEQRHVAFQNQSILACLGNVWSDVLAEVQANAGCDLVYWTEDLSQLEDLDEGSTEHNRRELLTQNDPVNTIRLKDYIRAHLNYVDTNSLGVSIESFLE